MIPVLVGDWKLFRKKTSNIFQITMKQPLKPTQEAQQKSPESHIEGPGQSCENLNYPKSAIIVSGSIGS